METITFTVPGAAYTVLDLTDLFYDPAKYDGGTPESQAAHDAIHAATSRRVGPRGWAHTFTVTPDGACVLADYWESMGDPSGRDTDPEAKREQAACRLAVARIQAALAAADAGQFVPFWERRRSGGKLRAS